MFQVSDIYDSLPGWFKPRNLLQEARTTPSTHVSLTRVPGLVEAFCYTFLGLNIDMKPTNLTQLVKKL